MNLNGNFNKVDGLMKGTDVRLSGVKIGVVNKMYYIIINLKFKYLFVMRLIFHQTHLFQFKPMDSLEKNIYQ